MIYKKTIIIFTCVFLVISNLPENVKKHNSNVITNIININNFLDNKKSLK